LTQLNCHEIVGHACSYDVIFGDVGFYSIYLLTVYRMLSVA